MVNVGAYFWTVSKEEFPASGKSSTCRTVKITHCPHLGENVQHVKLQVYDCAGHAAASPFSQIKLQSRSNHNVTVTVAVLRLALLLKYVFHIRSRIGLRVF